VAGRADGGKSRFGGEPSARGYVKDAHTRRNVSCAQQEGHEVHRNVRERPVVLCRRLNFEAEFLWHPRLCLFSSESKGRFSLADRWKQGPGRPRASFSVVSEVAFGSTAEILQLLRSVSFTPASRPIRQSRVQGRIRSIAGRSVGEDNVFERGARTERTHSQCFLPDRVASRSCNRRPAASGSSNVS
jgi:hypothetical protein